MGFTSFLGMLLSFAAIVYGIISVGGQMSDFINIPSIILTVVPTFTAVVATFPLSVITKMGAHMKVLLGKGYEPEDYVNKIMDIARKVRAEGLLSLEADIDNKMDPFMQYAVRMILDGVNEAEVRSSLESNLDGLASRHNEAIAIYEKMAAYAPAFGMCSTVIGLINMLKGLDFTDPNSVNSLGGNMSMALITTLYGSMLANIFFLPIAGRLKTLHKKEYFTKVMIGNGLLAIQRGENPNIISDMLMEHLNAQGKKRLQGLQQKQPQGGGAPLG